MRSAKEIVKDFLIRRAQAYRNVLNKESPTARIVLKDLAKFCRATQSTFHTDPRVEALLEGRREVWLRISQHLQLSDDELWNLLNKE